MSYAKIPLNFATMDSAYKDYKSLPADIAKWLKNQNDWEDKQGLPHSTTCCMQASLSFNATSQPIPKAGSRDRDNTTLDQGKNYILAVNEFRAYLTFKYGPTDQVTDLASIKGKQGVLIFGNSHIEFWDGENIFQSSAGAARRRANASAVMAGAILNSSPRWFWEIGDDVSVTSAALPEWVQGWWTVYDGNYYYYYFHPDGLVNYIESKPNQKWIPPKKVGNQGTVKMTDHGLKIAWKELGPPPPTEETFTQVNWSSTTEMNGVSNKYSPLFARKMST
jgi:hypothetical protein